MTERTREIGLRKAVGAREQFKRGRIGRIANQPIGDYQRRSASR